MSTHYTQVLEHIRNSEEIPLNLANEPAEVPVLEGVARLGFDCPKFNLIIEIISSILLALAIAGIVAGAVFVMTAVLAVGITLAVLTVTAIALSIVHRGVVQKTGVSHHDMENHHYEEIEIRKTNIHGVEGVIARMSYQGHVPVMTLDYENFTPRQIGEVQGEYFAREMDVLVEKYSKLSTYEEMLSYSAEDLKIPITDFFDQILPDRFKEELIGMVEGYQSKQDELGLESDIDLKKLLIFNLSPEIMGLLSEIPSKNLQFQALLKLVQRGDAPASALRDILDSVRKSRVACTAVIDRLDDGSIALARNLDWHPAASHYEEDEYRAGGVGTFNFMIERKFSGNRRTLGVGIPTLIGTLTGMNTAGLCLAMNAEYSARSIECDGIPSLFNNRMLLEECDDLADVGVAISKRTVYGPYHLSLIDSSRQGASVHFKQVRSIVLGRAGRTNVRRWKSQKTPLVVINNTCPEDHGLEAEGRGGDEGDGSYSLAEIHKYYARVGRDKEALSREEFKDILSLPQVNNSQTSHSTTFIIDEDGAASMEVKFDNGYAGDKPFHTVTFTQD